MAGMKDAVDDAHVRVHPRCRRACARTVHTVRLLFVVVVVCMTHCAAQDVMGEAVEDGAAAATRKSVATQATLESKRAAVRAVEKKPLGVGIASSPFATAKGEAEKDDKKKKDLELPVRGVELSPAQLEAIGVTKDPPRGATARVERKEEQAAEKHREDEVQTQKEDIRDFESSGGGDDDTKAQAAANASIDHVEAHLHILQQLELSVAQSIEEMNEKVDSRYSKQRSGETLRLSQELLVLQVCHYPFFANKRSDH